MSENKKSYYAIIPANVRYDKTLCANAKLLYGEITALCNQEGYCWAGNEYFAELYDVHDKTISKWVKQLIDAGYLTAEYTKHGFSVTQRKLFLAVQGYPPVTKTLPHGERKDYPTGNEKVTYNNTTNNTNNNTVDSAGGGSAVTPSLTIINTKRFVAPSIDDVQTYCSERKNGIDAEQFMNYYESKGWLIGKNKMKDWKAAIRTWESRQKKTEQKTEDYYRRL